MGQSVCRERPEDKLRKIRPVARLLGAKWVRRDDKMAILRVPRWLPDSVVDEAVKRIEADYKFAWPDAQPIITRHRNLIRFVWRIG